MIVILRQQSSPFARRVLLMKYSARKEKYAFYLQLFAYAVANLKTCSYKIAKEKSNYFKLVNI